jgi:putative exosortase-associated protein (TIGR04073 family)
VKKFVIFKTIVILMLTAPFFCYAEGNAGKPAISKPFVKFGRGIVNTISSPLELPNQMYILSDHANENSTYRIETAAAAIEGMFMGTVYAFWRLGAGIYEVITFPIPHYESRMITPPYLTISYEEYYAKEKRESSEEESDLEMSSHTSSENVNPHNTP